MNRKISTLMASLLFASAFVGTADAALKPVETGKAPVVGQSYVLGTVFGSGQVTKGLLTAGNVTVTDAATDVTDFEKVWTLESA